MTEIYISEVKAFGNGARINGKKKLIGRKVLIIPIDYINDEVDNYDKWEKRKSFQEKRE